MKNSTPCCVAGLDLGTTNTCISVFRNNGVEIVLDKDGHRTTPSIVSFTESGRKVGFSALIESNKNAKNTIYESKRFIGHQFDSPAVKSDLSRYPYVVKADAKGRPTFEVEFMGQVQCISPEEIASYIIQEMVEKANKFLGSIIKDIVITVPAYFNDIQRQATRDAGVIAGYNVLHVMSEPTAAAIAYGYENVNVDKKILVYDLGGGTFDVTILSVVDKNFVVLGTAGDTNLGGSDFDHTIACLILDELEEKDPSFDIENDPQALLKLKKEAEKAKIQLTYNEDETIYFKGQEFSITRQRFVDACKEQFGKTVKIIDDVLLRTQLTPADIDEVVMIGGSSRIPYIHQMLEQKFGAQKISEKINADEAVSYGATLKAVQMFPGNMPVPGRESDIIIIDVVPLSFGIKTATGRFASMILRDTQIPCSVSNTYTTSKDNQARMKIRIYQGEREVAEQNHFIGDLIVEGLPLMPKKHVSVDVTMSIDMDGILSVKATEQMSKATCQVSFNKDQTHLSDAEIDTMRENAEAMKEFDQAQIRKLTLLNDLQCFSYKIEKLIEEKKDLIGDDLADYLAQFTPGLEEVLVLRLEIEEPVLTSWKNDSDTLIKELEELVAPTATD